MVRQAVRDQAEDVASDGRLTRRRAWERDARLWSGMILMLFLVMHLMNHALGIFGIDTMETVQDWRMTVWRSLPGQIALYGAAAVHIVLTLKRVVSRRTLRMPRDEALQIVLGLVIPVLLVSHVASTRIVASMFDVDESYGVVMPRIWVSGALWQTALVIVSWLHGCIGLHHAFRWRLWYARWKDAGTLIALLVPMLALSGFVAGSREVLRERGMPPGPVAEQQAVVMQTLSIFHAVFAGVMAALVITVLVRLWMRRRNGVFSVRYTGHGKVDAQRGLSILEVSRLNNIPHPARCGGRARCSTCRVLVTAGADKLPAPARAEARLLARIAAPSHVRLACQLRPRSDVGVQILLPFLATKRPGVGEDAFSWGTQQRVTVLFVDMRAFNAIAGKQFPHDLVILLNRFLGEMTQAVHAHGGQVSAYLTDGLMALFGLDQPKDSGARAGIAAALAMLQTARALDDEFGLALSIPLRIGIGLHTGDAVIGRFGDPDTGLTVSALGETVTIASALEAATKSVLADCLVSDEALKASGMSPVVASQRDISVPGRDTPIIAHALAAPATAAVPARDALAAAAV